MQENQEITKTALRRMEVLVNVKLKRERRLVRRIARAGDF
jgi:hypothetical protein